MYIKLKRKLSRKYESLKSRNIQKNKNIEKGKATRQNICRDVHKLKDVKENSKSLYEYICPYFK